MGFLGILEDHKLPHVPATVILDEQSVRDNHTVANLKHGTGKSAHIVLVPQPSEDPNDPLNWPESKKVLVICIIGLGACLFAATFGPLLNAGLVVLAMEFGKEIGDITILSGYTLLVAGCTGALASGFSRKYGKRPVFIVSSLFGLIGCIVGSATNSYNGLVAAKVIQGFAIAAYESLVISIIGDLFFVHQRGFYMTGIQFILAAVSNFSSVICGPITSNLGWKYLFHFCVLVSGIQTILLILFVPETQYNRDARYNIDELVDENLEDLASVEKRHAIQLVEMSQDTSLEKSHTVTSNVSHHRLREKKTFVQEMAVFTGTYCQENVFQLIISPFASCTNLAVLWVVIVSGTITATYVAQSFVIAQIFSPPPYLMGPAGVGYLSVGPFLGGILGLLVFGPMVDPLIKWCSRKNGGVYEPEYRLLPMIPGLLAGAGLFGFGALTQNHANAIACDFFWGLTIFGVVAMSVSTAGYALDAYREMSSEIFVAGIVYKNFLFYAFTYFVNNWTATAGPQVVFSTFGGITFALALSFIPVFIFGKKYRSWWARNNLLEKMHIKTHSEI